MTHERTEKWQPGQPRASRQQADRVAMDAKLDAQFTGKKWHIVREIHLPEDQRFQTMFGHQGRHGYILREASTGEEIVVGRKLFKIIRERYLGVPKPRRRPRIVDEYTEDRTRIFPLRDG
jgi:hypothetical protein